MKRWCVLASLLLALPAAAADKWPDAGGGGSPSWFSALQLADEKMRTAVNNTTYEWHHWASEEGDRVFASVDANDWASFNTSCTTGFLPGGHQFIVDFGVGDDCVIGPGGGTTSGKLCYCQPTSTGYAPAEVSVETPSRSRWTSALLDGGGGVGIAGPYADDAPSETYQVPMIRLDPLTADSCVTVEEVNHPVTFGYSENPVFYYEVVPWNFDAFPFDRDANVADTIFFIGWKRDDVATGTPGFESYIDTSPGTGVTALDPAKIIDGFGVLWVASKWYAVWIRSSTLYSDLIFDPAVVYGSLTNYLTLHTGGATSFLIQTDIGTHPNGRKRGAYLVTPSANSANARAEFTSFSQGPLGAPNPESGTGPGIAYHRVASACVKTGSAVTKARFFFTQMDVVK